MLRLQLAFPLRIALLMRFVEKVFWLEPNIAINAKGKSWSMEQKSGLCSCCSK